MDTTTHEPPGTSPIPARKLRQARIGYASVRRFGDEALLAPFGKYRLDMLGGVLDRFLWRLLAASDVGHHFRQQMLAVDLANGRIGVPRIPDPVGPVRRIPQDIELVSRLGAEGVMIKPAALLPQLRRRDRKSTRLNT